MVARETQGLPGEIRGFVGPVVNLPTPLPQAWPREWKLTQELSRRANDSTRYILNEPATGLHFEDVRKLLEVLHALVQTRAARS